MTADALFHDHLAQVQRRTDRIFGRLMVFQWAAAIAGALWLAPITWAGAAGSLHPHVWAAVVIGTVITALPVYFALTRPGDALTRHVIAVGQMLMSALLIDITGGRIETHFHVFGSLAFLAFYRDWRVLVSASIVVAADHFVRGAYFPVSVYGVENAGAWRWIEHAAWVVFEDVFLVAACLRGVREMREIAERTAEIRGERDRSEREVRERTRDLSQSVERFRSLSISSPVAIFETDRDGRCTYANPRWEEISGQSMEKTLGTGWADALHPEDRDVVVKSWQDATFAGGEWTSEHRILRPDGATRWVHARARAVVDQEGRTVGFVGTVEDISDRRAAEDHRRSLEEQLRQSHKMEAVGRLAGGIAHDFNNLLTAIVGFGRMVKTDLGPDHPSAVPVGQIVRAGENAADLVHQLLAFSRRQVLHVTVLDVREVVTGAAPMLRRVLGETVDFRTTLSPKLGAVRADRGQIEQVIVNLAVNARDAMPDGGTLTIETADVELDAHYAASNPDVRPGRYVMLSVSDTGVGMDEKTRRRLFEPFFTTKEMGRGTGLGLATVYGIVRQSEGHIGVYSEPGIGTSMKVYLPRIDADAEAGERTGLVAPPRGAETVLIVEDEEGVRLLAQMTLARLGYTVFVTTSAREALDAVAGHAGRIDLVLTDVVMPGMGGRQLVERLVAQRPHIKALYMSGYTDDAMMSHGILQDEARFLQKPFTPEALADKVRGVLDGAPAAAQTASEPRPARARGD